MNIDSEMPTQDPVDNICIGMLTRRSEGRFYIEMENVDLAKSYYALLVSNSQRTGCCVEVMNRYGFYEMVRVDDFSMFWIEDIKPTEKGD